MLIAGKRFDRIIALEKTSLSDDNLFVSENYKNVAELLSIEADAIRAAAERLDQNAIEKSIELLTNCDGKVIVFGVGKSGVIAQKIAQTMTSTGTIAVAIHPSDALHGSLGVVARGDLVLALSNSGETDEILALIPAIKNRGINIISIVGNVDSTLAGESDVVLDASVDKEACPLNLAPKLPDVACKRLFSIPSILPRKPDHGRVG